MLHSKSTLFKYLSQATSRINPRVEEDNSGNLQLIRYSCNAHFELLKETSGFLGKPWLSDRTTTETVVFTSLYKNCVNFYSALELITKGLHGPAMVLLRPIFESLYISKYCNTTGNTQLYDRWQNGEHINIPNEILNKVNDGQMPEARKLLRALNQFSHHTIYSSQISLLYKHEATSISAGICIIKMLVTMSHHLITQHYFTRKMHYYFRTYPEAERVRKSLELSRKLYSVSRKSMTTDSKKLIREYASSWATK